MKGRILADLAWDEVRGALAERVAVIPLGAACKEHGPHLPLDTDFRQAEALGRRLAERSPVVVWPAVGYATYPAFVAYPGSVSVPRDATREVLAAAARAAVHAGAPAVLILNTGVSTIRPSVEALEDLGVPGRAVHVYASDAHRAARAELLDQARGGHADEAETSVMLHLFPERVRMDRAVAWTRPMTAGRWSPDDPDSPRYSPSGVFGDPTLATADKGARIVSAMLAELEAAVAELMATAGDGRRSSGPVEG